MRVRVASYHWPLRGRYVVDMPKRRRREGAWHRRNKVLQSVCIYPLDYINCLTVCLTVCLFFQQKTNDHSEGSGGEPGVRGAGYTPIVKENDRFVKYYQVCQKLLFLALIFALQTKTFSLFHTFLLIPASHFQRSSIPLSLPFLTHFVSLPFPLSLSTTILLHCFSRIFNVIRLLIPSLPGSGTGSRTGMGPVYVHPQTAAALHVQNHGHPPRGYCSQRVSPADLLPGAEQGPAGRWGGVSSTHSTTVVCCYWC